MNSTESVHSHSDRPRVFVDAAILKPALAGIGSYTRGLVGALAARDEFQITVATSVPEQFESLPGVDIVSIASATRDFAKRTLWREVRLKSLLHTARADVLVAPVPELPLRRLTIPSVVVLHDVSQVLAPALYGWPKWIRYAAGLRLTCASASAVVCVSNWTLLGVQYAVGMDDARCRVIGQGPQSLPVRHGPNAAVTLRAEETPPFILYVGTMLAHKNVEVVMEAISRFGASLGKLEFKLVGPLDADEERALHQKIRELGLHGRVTHLGFVPAHDLAVLYERAAAVVLPSLIEGFGLPVLEAMTRGTPVIASDLPALRELAGDAAIFVDRPTDADAWSIAMRPLLEDGALCEELAARGYRRAERYSWSRVGDEFAELLRGLVA